MALLRVERRIEYFKLTAKDGDNGLFGEKLKEIVENLSPADRECEERGTSINLELFSPSKSNLICGTIKQLRSTAPSKRKKGHIQTKPVELEADEGIDEKTHFIYCPESSLICIEYNYHGPKIGLLVSVVNKIYKDKLGKKEKRSSYIYVQTGKAFDEVTDRRYVRSVTAKLVDPKTMANLSDDLDLPEVFEQFKAPKNSTIEISIKSKVKGTPVMGIQELRRLFLRDKQDIDYFDKLKVSVEDDQTGKSVEYDLIKDKLSDDFMVELKEGTSEINTDKIMEILEERILRVKETYYT